MSIPVVIAANGYGIPVKAVSARAPKMVVSPNGYGLPIVISEFGVPFIVDGLVAAAPVITGVPTISGTETEGQTLSVTAASVTGSPTPTRSYQWERSGTPISGATSGTYTLVSADVGETLTVVQTETNASGSDTAESAATGVIGSSVAPGTLQKTTIPTIAELAAFAPIVYDFGDEPGKAHNEAYTSYANLGSAGSTYDLSVGSGSATYNKKLRASEGQGFLMATVADGFDHNIMAAFRIEGSGTTYTVRSPLGNREIWVGPSQDQIRLWDGVRHDITHDFTAGADQVVESRLSLTDYEVTVNFSSTYADAITAAADGADYNRVFAYNANGDTAPEQKIAQIWVPETATAGQKADARRWMASRIGAILPGEEDKAFTVGLAGQSLASYFKTQFDAIGEKTLAHKIGRITGYGVQCQNGATGASSLFTNIPGLESQAWWLTTTDQPTSTYTNFLTSTPDATVIMWSQGEADCGGAGFTKAEYKTVLRKLFQRMYADKGLQIFINMLGRRTSSYAVAEGAQWIREVQSELADELSYVHIGANQITSELLGSVQVHPSAIGMQNTAAQLTGAILKHYGEISDTPPTIVSVERTGDTIAVTLDKGTGATAWTVGDVEATGSVDLTPGAGETSQFEFRKTSDRSLISATSIDLTGDVMTFTFGAGVLDAAGEINLFNGYNYCEDLPQSKTIATNSEYALTFHDVHGQAVVDLASDTTAPAVNSMTFNAGTGSLDIGYTETNLPTTVRWHVRLQSSGAPDEAAMLDGTGALDSGSFSSDTTTDTEAIALDAGLTADDYTMYVMISDGAGNHSNIEPDNFTLATAPDAFATEDWFIADAGTGGAADVTIADLPAANNATIADVEYSIDNGTWTSSGGTTDFSISGLTDDVAIGVEIRAVNSEGAGPDGVSKSVTPTTAAGPESYVFSNLSGNTGHHQGVVSMPNGDFVLAGNNRLTRYNSNWTLQADNNDPMGDISAPGNMINPFTHDGKIYAVRTKNGTTDVLAAWDATTLAYDAASEVPFTAGPSFAGFSCVSLGPDPANFYGVEQSVAEIEIHSLTTGAYLGSIPMENPATLTQCNGLAFFNSRWWFACRPNNIYSSAADGTDIQLEFTYADGTEISGLSSDDTQDALSVLFDGNSKSGVYTYQRYAFDTPPAATDGAIADFVINGDAETADLTGWRQGSFPFSVTYGGAVGATPDSNIFRGAADAYMYQPYLIPEAAWASIDAGLATLDFSCSQFGTSAGTPAVTFFDGDMVQLPGQLINSSQSYDFTAWVDRSVTDATIPAGTRTIFVQLLASGTSVYFDNVSCNIDYAASSGVTLVASDTIVVTAGTAEGAVSLPASLEDDWVVLCMGSDNAILDQADANTLWSYLKEGQGWENLDLAADGDANPGRLVARKKMGATPDTTVTVRAAGGRDLIIHPLVFRGADGTEPFDNSISIATGASGLPDAPSHTTLSANTIRVIFGVMDDISQTLTAPAGWTAIETASSNCSTIVCTLDAPTAGTVDPAAFGGVNTDVWGAYHFAVRPA